jgi:hypothetical protein
MRGAGFGSGDGCRNTASFDSSGSLPPKLSQLAAARGLGGGSSRQEQRATIRIVKTTRSGEILDGVELKHILFRGGYQDFIPYPEELECLYLTCQEHRLQLGEDCLI